MCYGQSAQAAPAYASGFVSETENEQMTATTFDREYNKASCVDENFFKRVEKLASDPAGPLEVTLWLSDSSRINELTVDDLIVFPNVRSRQIVRVDIETPYRAETKVRLTIRSDDFIAPISYQIVGDDKEAMYLSAELDKLLRDSFVWHSYLSVLNVGLILAAFFVIFLGLMAQLLGFVGMTSSATGEVIVAPNLYLKIIPLFFIIPTILFWVVRKRVFPAITFCMGDGVVRANKAASARQVIASTIFGGVVVGLLVHVFGSQLYKAISGH